MTLVEEDAERAIDELRGLKRGRLTIGASTTIKVTKADKAGTSQAIAVGISYGPSYLREQMLKD